MRLVSQSELRILPQRLNNKLTFLNDKYNGLLHEPLSERDAIGKDVRFKAMQWMLCLTEDGSSRRYFRLVSCSNDQPSPLMVEFGNMHISSMDVSRDAIGTMMSVDAGAELNVPYVSRSGLTDSSGRGSPRRGLGRHTLLFSVNRRLSTISATRWALGWRATWYVRSLMRSRSRIECQG